MTLTEKRQISGRKGGLSTLRKHGPDHFRSAGSLGGRPRRLTYAEMQAMGLLSNTEKGGRLQEGFSFKGWKIVLELVREANQ